MRQIPESDIDSHVTTRNSESRHEESSHRKIETERMEKPVVSIISQEEQLSYTLNQRLVLLFLKKDIPPLIMFCLLFRSNGMK